MQQPGREEGKERGSGRGRKGREVSWEVSNLGSFSCPGVLGDERSGWTINRAVFTQGANATGAAMNVNVAGVAGKGIYAEYSAIRGCEQRCDGQRRRHHEVLEAGTES